MAIVDVPDRLSELPSPQVTVIETTLAPFDAELVRVSVTCVPVVEDEGPLTVSVGGAVGAFTVRVKTSELPA